jgi:hypothetical protein
MATGWLVEKDTLGSTGLVPITGIIGSNRDVSETRPNNLSARYERASRLDPCGASGPNDMPERARIRRADWDSEAPMGIGLTTASVSPMTTCFVGLA